MHLRVHPLIHTAEGEPKAPPMADSAATTTAAADDGSANAPPPMSKRARTTGDGDETNPSLASICGMND